MGGGVCVGGLVVLLQELKSQNKATVSFNVQLDSSLLFYS